MHLTNKVFVVTGGGNGMGRSCFQSGLAGARTSLL